MNVIALKYFNEHEIEAATSYPDLIKKLKSAFREKYEVPERIYVTYESGEGVDDSTLLLMPTWENSTFAGIKILSVSPYNTNKQLSTIKGAHVLLNASSSQTIAHFDAKSSTNMRTAASSVLASKFLSYSHSKKVLMIGRDALAAELSSRYCLLRPSKKVWGSGGDAIIKPGKWLKK